MCFTDSEVGQSQTTDTFLGYILTLPSETMNPRKDTEVVWKAHLSALSNWCAFNRHWRTCLTCLMCSEVGEKQYVISIYEDEFLQYLPKHIIHSCLKIVGVLVSPNDIPKYS